MKLLAVDTTVYLSYIEEWRKLHIKNNSKVSKATFIDKYGIMSLYDEDLKKKIHHWPQSITIL